MHWGKNMIFLVINMFTHGTTEQEKHGVIINSLSFLKKYLKQNLTGLG